MGIALGGEGRAGVVRPLRRTRPSAMRFGGEAKVSRQLRRTLRRAHVEDEDFADARDADEAAALDEERARLGRRISGRERAAFLGGFRATRSEHANVW